MPAPGVLGNDTDAESDPLTAVLAGGPSHGSLTLNPDGSFTYTHDGSETTSDSFTYRANDGSVDSNTATVTITVTSSSNFPPVAEAGPDQSGATRQNLTFNGSGSYDTGGTITSWFWDFGDGKSGSGEVVLHNYRKAGTYTVTLTVTDNQGAQDTDSATITIN